MKELHTFIFAVLSACHVLAQNVTISPNGITPALSGSYPRLSYDVLLSLPNPQIGDIAYDLTFKCLRQYNGSKWLCTYQSPKDLTPEIALMISAGGTMGDSSYGMAVDASGNVYVTGAYIGTITFGAISKTSAGEADIFVAKYNSSGTLEWVQSAGGASNDFGRGIAVDASGNVYVTGAYIDTATFETITKTSVGVYDIFVAKYNSSGNLQWVQSAGGTSTDYGRGIAVDASGNVFITGYFTGNPFFEDTGKISAGAEDMFVAKYNTSGTLQWVRSAGGPSSDFGYGITIDATGNVYVTGNYSNYATFGAVYKTSAGSSDIFLAKYNSNGNFQWVQSAGGTSSLGDQSFSVAVDASENVFVTGHYSGTATFDATTITSAGGVDIFVAKYNSSGVLQWVQSAGGTLHDMGYGVALDTSENVYVTGYYAVTATFGAATQTSTGGTDVFLAKYNSNGTLQWLQGVGGTSNDYGYGIAINASGKVFIMGQYIDTVTFGATSITSAGNSDIFVVRVDNQ